ncbi:DHA2 family efflux MFS transporter permease subunit [Tomitella gaofuii]|uniref:DHA2 family efflux MFS transporter permease subunit n=1 Tax=Tomitella gaofuii TaxID=2760083 RepID=UPI0015FC3847|nr:DHA2 family efflux MFS transporter permease subunit [Tomitella gaofuii]
MTTTSTPELPGAPADDDAAGARLRARPLWLTLLAVSLPMFMATLDNLVMTSALPVVQAHLHASVTQLEWFMNSYTLAFATLMLAAAGLGDRWGRRRVFVWGIALFTAGSIASALSTSPATLIIGRTVQGIGAAAILPLSLALLAGAVPESRRALAIGVWGGVSGLGVALGPVIGGAIVDGISWQAIFWLNVPVAVIAIPLVLATVDETRSMRVHLDPGGVLLAGAAVFLTVWAIVHGNDDGWGAPGVVVPLIVAAALAGAFVAWELRARQPVMPMRLFRSRNFTLANIIAVAFSLGMFGAVFLLVQYLQVVMGYSPLEAGLRTLPWTAAPMVVAPLAGALAPRVGLRPLLTAGLALQAGSLAWMAALLGPSMEYAALIPAMVMAGVGMGLTFAPVATAVLADLADADHAAASSTNSTLREVGVALGIAVLTAVFLGAGGQISPVGFDGALQPALLVGAVVVAAGAVAALFLPGRNAEAGPQAPSDGAAPGDPAPGDRAPAPTFVAPEVRA